MKTVLAAALFNLVLSSSPLWAVIEMFVEIAPSEIAEGPHTKVNLEKQREGKLLLTLTRISGLEAWLVVCEKERGQGNRNFRHEVHWPQSSARKKDVELVAPIAFSNGVASLQLTEDLAARSYIVFGGHFDDGTFYTVNLPAFQRAMTKEDE